MNLPDAISALLFYHHYYQRWIRPTFSEMSPQKARRLARDWELTFDRLVAAVHSHVA